MSGEPLNEFDEWLCQKLNSLDIDSEIYGSYLTSILEEGDDDNQKKESISEVLGAFLEESAPICEDLLKKWNQVKESSDSSHIKTDETGIEEILAAHVTAKHQKVPKKEETSEELNAVKQSVIAMYSSVDVEGEEITESKKDVRQKTVDDALDIFKNTNASSVSDAEKQERFKQKKMADEKKEKDKHDREMQKIKKNERKEKEKKRTQKKERTR